MLLVRFLRFLIGPHLDVEFHRNFGLGLLYCWFWHMYMYCRSSKLFLWKSGMTSWVCSGSHYLLLLGSMRGKASVVESWYIGSAWLVVSTKLNGKAICFWAYIRYHSLHYFCMEVYALYMILLHDYKLTISCTSAWNHQLNNLLVIWCIRFYVQVIRSSMCC